MRILITGANGFIARAIITRLQAEQHQLIACARTKQTVLTALPNIELAQLDFLSPPSSAQWQEHLKNVDVVINCVGVFQTVKTATMWQIHAHAPRTLFNACVAAGVQQIIQISALGIDQSDTEYAKSKLAAEAVLTALPINSVIIRPSLVYDKDCYGGSALLRGLAGGLPGVIFLPGNAEQLMQPVHLADLAQMVSTVLARPGKHLLYAVGAEQLSLRRILNTLRAWLGFRVALNLKIPLPFIKTVAKLGDFIPNAALSTTGIKMLALDSIATPAQQHDTETLLTFTPRGFSQGLATMTSGVQDRWHARLFFLRTLLQLALAFIWLYSGAVSILTAATRGYPLLTQAGISLNWQPLLLYGSSALNILLGIATLFNFRFAIVGTVQIMLTLVYTLIITCTLPSLWLEPFAPVAKNIPLLAATLIMLALASAR